MKIGNYIIEMDEGGIMLMTVICVLLSCFLMCVGAVTEYDSIMWLSVLSIIVACILMLILVITLVTRDSGHMLECMVNSLKDVITIRKR